MTMYGCKSSSVPLDHKIKTSVSLRASIIFKQNLLILLRSIMRKLIFLFLPFAFLLLPLTYSQPVTQEWAARYPGPSNDLIGPFLAVDKQGNSYIAGTHVVNDSLKILCVKYNTSGVQQWATLFKFPEEGYYAPTGIALDSSGNAYVISYFAQTYIVPYNGLIIKFNSLNGSPVWAKKYVGQYGESAFNDIKIDRLNNIYVTGASDSSHLVIRYNYNGDSVWVRKYHPRPLCREGARACTLDDSLNIIFTGKRRHYYPPSGYFDSLLVAKYSPGGIFRWESVYAYNYLGEDVGIKITADQNGNSYIGGVTTVSGLGVYLTLKYDRNGVRQWAKIYDAPGSGSNTLNGIAMDRINNALYITGGAVTNGVQMATTIKYNIVTGDSIWVRKDTGTYKYGDSRAIKLDAYGNAYITGVSSSTGSGAPVDILTIKYLHQGVRSWVMTFNGPFNGLDIGRDLGLDELNNVYVLGTSQSSTQVSDYVIVKYNQLNGIEPISNEIPKNFQLEQNYPNPFNPSTRIRFSVPQRCVVQLRIYDILGRLKDLFVNEYVNLSEYELTVDAAKYSSGTYFYQLIADGKIIETKKMIVLK
jgi:hypothetical protein